MERGKAGQKDTNKEIEMSRERATERQRKKKRDRETENERLCTCMTGKGREREREREFVIGAVNIMRNKRSGPFLYCCSTLASSNRP